MEERNRRKVLRGTVVSDKMDKTIVVEIDTTTRHPVYGKRVKYSNKFKAHDENNVAKQGDIVRIRECRPISKDKTFFVEEILQQGESPSPEPSEL